MLKNILAVFILAVSSLHVSADTLYRWVDKDGKVHYGDRPAEGNVKVERKSFSAGSAAVDENMPYEVRKAAQNFPVTLYTNSSCGSVCDQARQFLAARGIPYSEKSLKTPEEIEHFKSKLGGKSMPALQIGRSMNNGFAQDQWASELELAGYPRTPAYGYKPKPKLQAGPESKDVDNAPPADASQ